MIKDFLRIGCRNTHSYWLGETALHMDNVVGNDGSQRRRFFVLSWTARKSGMLKEIIEKTGGS